MSNTVTLNSPSTTPKAEAADKPGGRKAEVARPAPPRLAAVPKPERPIQRQSSSVSDSDVVSDVLSAPIRMTAPPRPTVAKAASAVARRVLHLSMDAALIILFAPVIAGWVLIERRRRSRAQI